MYYSQDTFRTCQRILKSSFWLSFLLLLFILFNRLTTDWICSCKEPDRAPTDVEVWTPHSTALHVSWNEVPNAYKNGIIRGYKGQYTEMNANGSSETEDLQPWKRSLSITGLKKFTLYNITVVAYTSKGDGVSCIKVLMTDQDGMFAILEIKVRARIQTLRALLSAPCVHP